MLVRAAEVAESKAARVVAVARAAAGPLALQGSALARQAERQALARRGCTP
jgi:hypothetical protein